MSAAAPPIALLDACVLAPLILRESLLAAAREGLFRPRWSDRIEAEWRRAAAKEARGAPAALIDGDIALARAAHPDALVAGWEAHEGPLALPDWEDRHVLAAAIAAGAALLVTDNLRDFPKRTLAAHGMRPVGGDAYLTELLADAPEAMGRALARIEAMAPPEARAQGLAKLLKRGRLPRFAKAAARAGFASL
ncbi:MAG: PIN domain-containing protein [Pseudomonadota bacterium]